ncbi:MAG: phospholipid-translocating P-type ATPase [archaeon]|nr:phospholipid-translocating P-type ATPase [archaeon]
MPLAIFYQFNSGFNIFFLCSAVLSCITIISPVSPVSAVVPFVIVLVIGLIKEAIEDLKKYFYDRDSNNSICIKYVSPAFVEAKWSDVEVGNIIKVKKDETLPADILVIKSSNENGFCFLETSNLDGETALKPREALNATQTQIVDEKGIDQFFSLRNYNETYAEVDQPNENIYEIEGTSFINSNKFYFEVKNILLRGGKLKNVDYVYGIVIYTGKDTKLLQNIKHSSLKTSHIDKKLNIIVLYILIVCLVLTVVATVIGSVFRSKNMPDYDEGDLNADYILYFNEDSNDALEIIRILVANFTTFTTLIPISIMITMAVIKTIQVFVMELGEARLRRDPEDQVKCFSTTLQDDLGMVKFIFTDKTGTLTKNQMEFKSCSIFTQIFNEDTKKPENILDPFEELKGKSFIESQTFDKRKKSIFTKNFKKSELTNLLKDRSSQLLVKDLNGCPFNSQGEAITEYFLDIAINHDVLAEIDKKTGELGFQGANPDEVTLVTAANEMGFTFVSRENNVVEIKVYDYATDQIVTRHFEVLQKFDFTSARQRSSIIVKDLLTNQIKLYLKGSDTKVFASLDQYSQKNILPKAKEHVDGFARTGLRTLCYSMKFIDLPDYNKWEREYADLKYRCINDKSLNSKLEECIGEIESKALLLGVSALEDKLQDEVKNDLQHFIEAGINVWMITGDKMDTAESIGHSCKLFTEDTEVFKIKTTSDVDEVIERMKVILKTMNNLQRNVDDFHEEVKVNAKKRGAYKLISNSMELAKPTEDGRPEIFTTTNEEKKPMVKQRKGLKKGITVNLETKNKMPLDEEKQEQEEEEGLKANEIHDASVFRFMYDKGLFENTESSVMDNMSILQGKVIQASIEASKQQIGNHEEYKKEEGEGEENPQLQHVKSMIPRSQEKMEIYYNICREKIVECRAINNRRFFCFDITRKIKKKLYDVEDVDEFEEEDLRLDPNEITMDMNFGLIVEGQAITTCMTEGIAAKLFWKLIRNSKSLICCRSSPLQKSQIVNFIKMHNCGITLAIGDGGNDVNMIKTADVGVGIFGKEGYQAAFNSDFAIAQFKYLKELIFIEGRFCLSRNSYFIYHYFFKNVIYTMPQFWLCIYSGFSGTNIYDEIYYMSYNTFITLLVLCAYTIVEEDYDCEFKSYKQRERRILKKLIPDIFAEYRDSFPFNVGKFFAVFFASIAMSVIPYFFFYGSFKDSLRSEDGQPFCFWDYSLGVFLSSCLIHFFVMLVDTHFWEWLAMTAFLLQLAIIICFVIIYQSLDLYQELSGDLYGIIKSPIFWLAEIVIVALCFLPVYFYRRIKYYFGGRILDNILKGKFEHYYIEKFYEKKVNQMSKAVRSIAKFKRILAKKTLSLDVDDVGEQNMVKMAIEYKRSRSKKNLDS